MPDQNNKIQITITINNSELTQAITRTFGTFSPEAKKKFDELYGEIIYNSIKESIEYQFSDSDELYDLIDATSFPLYKDIFKRSADNQVTLSGKTHE